MKRLLLLCVFILSLWIIGCEDEYGACIFSGGITGNANCYERYSEDCPTSQDGIDYDIEFHPKKTCDDFGLENKSEKE